MDVEFLLKSWQELSGPVRLGTAGGGSLIFFLLASLSVNHFSWSRSPSPSKAWIWKNRWMSWLHAVIISVLTVISMYQVAPEYWHDNVKLLHYHSFLMQFTLAVSVGYFIHDMMDNLIFTFNGSLEGIAVIAHHVVAIGMFGVFTWLDHYCAYVMLAIATEINGVFLHNRKLLQLCGFEITDRVYIANNVVNVLTFLVFRVGGQLYMKYRIALVVGDAPQLLWVLGLLAMTSLQIVNMALANSLFVSDVKRWRQLQKVRRESISPDLPETTAGSNGHKASDNNARPRLGAS